MSPCPQSSKPAGSTSSSTRDLSTSLAQDTLSTENLPAIPPTYNPSAMTTMAQALTTISSITQNRSTPQSGNKERQDLVDRSESESAGGAVSNAIPITSDAAISHPRILIHNLQVHNIVRTLRFYAHWMYPQLHEALGISLSTLHQIVNNNLTTTSLGPAG